MSNQDHLKPVNLKAPHGATTLEITWADHHHCKYPHEILRGYCPCAGCQGHSGTIRFIPGGNLEIRDIEQVGRYALRFEWGDGHGSGLYTFQYLRTLCDLIEQTDLSDISNRPELPRT